MKAYIHQVLQIVLLTIAGTAGAVVLGLLAYGTNVFDVSSAGFSYISFGLSTSLIFAFYHVRGLSESITAAVVTSAVQFVLSSSAIAMLRAGLFSFGLNLPVVVLAFLFERKLMSMSKVRFLVVGLTFGCMFVLLTLLVGALSGTTGLPATLFQQNFIDGVLLGLGVGLGVGAGEALLHSLQHSPGEHGASTTKHP
jgi:hypothetical protein